MLTYMSIKEAVDALVLSQELTFLCPVMPGVSVHRDVYVGAEVLGLVGDDATPSSEYEKVSAKARARLDHFSAGKFVVFALNPRNKSVHSDIARNAPIDKGILDVRITDPNPKIRIFGGFLQPDVLVLLTWATRDNLDFTAEVDRCRKEWDRLLPKNPPVIGNKHEDYISHKFIVG
jgi:hypothetical protein